jgi:hypothetical protein
MKSGIEIVEMWLKEFHYADLPCPSKEFLVEAIEAGLNEAYREGQKANEKYRVREDGQII